MSRHPDSLAHFGSLYKRPVEPIHPTVITCFQEGQIVWVEDEMESNRVQLYLSLERWAGKTDEEGLERVLYLRLCLPLEFLSIIFFTISIFWLFFTQ